MLLNPVKLKVPAPTDEGRINGEDGSIWYVWSDNVDDRTLTCLPYRSTGGDEMSLFVFDLKTFSYDDVLCLPGVLDVVSRAAWTAQGMIEVYVPSVEADDVAAACKAGLLQMVGNGVAMVTPAGRDLVAH